MTSMCARSRHCTLVEVRGQFSGMPKRSVGITDACSLVWHYVGSGAEPVSRLAQLGLSAAEPQCWPTCIVL